MVLRRRHLAKAVTYRICGTLLTGTIAYCLTGSMAVSLILAPIDMVLKVGFYYLHERAWHKSKWGVREEDSP